MTVFADAVPFIICLLKIFQDFVLLAPFYFNIFNFINLFKLLLELSFLVNAKI